MTDHPTQQAAAPAAEERVGPAGRMPAPRRPPWLPVPFLVVVIAAVQLALPPSVTLGPIWLIPAIELVGIPLVWGIWHLSRADGFPVSDEVLGQAMALYLCFLVAASVLNASLLFRSLFTSADDTAGRLLFAGFGVLVINVLTFGLIYWWIDGGGPVRRAAGRATRWDFQYPQQSAGRDWTPTLLDYLYTAFTNTTAFSPTDTMPLTHRVKALFAVQSAISLLTILVTLSRAISLLPG